MLRRLSSKFRKDRDVPGPAGAAVPYREGTPPGPGTGEGTPRDPGSPARPGANGAIEVVRTAGPAGRAARGCSASESDGRRLGDAAEAGDGETVRRLIKQQGVDINTEDENGNTALHRAAAGGRSRLTRYLLLRGADIEARNKKGDDALSVAVDYNTTGTVGVLLDYMHSVDNRSRDPFVLLRAHKRDTNTYTVQKVASCTELKPFQKRGATVLNILITHGQQSEDLAIFLYSVLDVPVQHAFFINTVGETNMKNFQRFESKAKSQSLTVLNTACRLMDVAGYGHLRHLILVSCDLVRLDLGALRTLELLDVRYNRLQELPEALRDCGKLKTLRCANNCLKGLPRDLGDVTGCLVTLDCSHNRIKRLPRQLIQCAALEELHCDHNGLVELPHDVGLLTKLQSLVVNDNKLSCLPTSISTLAGLNRIIFHSNPLHNIPVDFPQRPDEVRCYLEALQTDPVPNTTVKLVLVGQEGVGKTTLLGALRKTFWLVTRRPDTPKTDGIEVKDIHLDGMTLRCFDCGGDVDFNETHNFFITQGALYLACFNLSEYCLATVEKSHFLLGRLQLWLQYIFSKVPSAQVVIVGTHADHPALTRDDYQQIWDLLRSLLVSARHHHRRYFSKAERLQDCLLCQSDSKCLRRLSGTGSSGFVNLGFEDTASLDEETSFADGPPGSAVSFPHIVGYYEVSSVKSVGNTSLLQANTNQSIQHLKDAIAELSRRLIRTSPEIPRRWADVQESLQNHILLHPNNAAASREEVSRIAAAHGASDTELSQLLQFLKAQGHVLYFPQLEELKDTVILDPQWLASTFSSIVSYRQTAIDHNGLVDRAALSAIWRAAGHSDDRQLLTLLRHFGICLPVSGTDKELFPCKLPLGDPDDNLWPPVPAKGQRQVTYRVTFPSMIPPPFFSSLLVAIYRRRAPPTEGRHPGGGKGGGGGDEDAGDDRKPAYFANKILDWLAVDAVGCTSCSEGRSGTNGGGGGVAPEPTRRAHQVLAELLAHIRAIQVTVRGPAPCCLLPRLNRLLQQVAGQFEGMARVELDTLLCAGCYLQQSRSPHKFNLKHLQQQQQPGGSSSKESQGQKLVCNNAHVIPNARSALIGVVGDSLTPMATLRPKSAKDSHDFSGCPKLFIVHPVSSGGTSPDSDLHLSASSLIPDGYAVHLLCEFPDGYHVTSSPGYRLKEPAEFMTTFGDHVIRVMRLLSHLAGSTVSSPWAGRTEAVTAKVDDLLEDLSRKFPACRAAVNATHALAAETLNHEILQRAAQLRREELRRQLHVVDKAAVFGALRRLRYGDNLLWLCGDHYRQLRVLTLGAADSSVQAYVESRA